VIPNQPVLLIILNEEVKSSRLVVLNDYGTKPSHITQNLRLATLAASTHFCHFPFLVLIALRRRMRRRRRRVEWWMIIVWRKKQ
jgi:hypothetical protein